MQVVINIPDNYIAMEISNGSIASQVILNAVKAGAILPKGHDALIYREEARMCLTGDISDVSIEEYISIIDKRLRTLPKAIIPADKEAEND